MRLDSKEVSTLCEMISRERLDRLTVLTGSEAAAIDLHQDILRLGGSLTAIIATIEIALRNTVCENLTSHFAVPNWLIQPPVPFVWREPEKKRITLAWDSARRAEYSKLTQAQKADLDAMAYPKGLPSNLSHAKRSQDRRKQIEVKKGKVIAELTLYFWKRLYGPEYEHSLWLPTLKRTFPDKSLRRAEVAENLEVIYQSRNRLAHHEPVLEQRFHRLMKAAAFVVERLGERKQREDTPLAKILQADFVEANARASRLHDRIAAYR